MSLKLESLEINGLKCYEESGVIPFYNLTVFIGENDAGKSTVFDALEFFLENKQPNHDDYRNDTDTIEISCIFKVDTEIDELQEYFQNNTIKIRKLFYKNEPSKVEVQGNFFVDNDLNIYNEMNAADLKTLLDKLGLEACSNQDLRKEAVMEYITDNELDKEIKYVEVRWNQISKYLPIFQRYTSSDYGNPTTLIRKTLELVYREAFYEKDADGNEKLKSTFTNLEGDIKESLNLKLETQLLSHVQKYKPEIVSLSGNYDIDFARGLNFSGLNVRDDNGRDVTLEQMGDGSKKKIFLSILEWDSEINIEAETTRNIIRAYDEPDAHLHYHSQREMFYIIRDLTEDSEANIQAIICTHALTMIDRAPANCINHVIKNNDKSEIKFLTNNEDQDIANFLNQISEVSGFKNSSIFYEKCFLLVEGEGEQNALPIMYKKCKGRSLHEDGIVLINLQTNGQWNNALKFLNANKKDCTVLFLDSDTQYETSKSRVTKEKLEAIGFDEQYLDNNCFFIGIKEFEDVFTDEQYKNLCNVSFQKGDSIWEEAEFRSLRGDDKFSESLKKLLSRGCRRNIGKPEISLKLAEYLEPEAILNVVPIKKLFDKINDIIT